MNYKLYYLLIFIIIGNNIKTFAQAGKLDSTFGVNGIVKWLRGGGEIALQPNGDIILGTNYEDSASLSGFFALSRYDSSGVLDSTFGINGRVETQIGGCCDEAWNEIIQANGKIVLGAYCVDNSGKGDYALVRYTANGKLDNTFNSSGTALTSFNTIGDADYGYSAAIEPDGKIVQVGLGNDNSGLPHFGVVRYDSTGAIDNTFGTNGKVLTSITGLSYAAATAVATQPDGKIIACGGSSDGNAPNCFALVRYNIDGSLDNTFGTGGEVTTYFGAGGSSGVNYDDDEESDLTLQPDGKIVVVGQSALGTDTVNAYNIAIALARYNTDGSLDNSFGNGGKLRIKISGYYYYYGGNITVQPDSKIIISGYVADSPLYSTQTFALFRYTANGLPDATFGIKGVDTIHIDTLTSGAGNIIFLPNGKFLAGGGVNATSIYYNYGIITRFISGLSAGILNFSVKQNPILIYPNPIKLQVTLQYALAQNENINITLYDMQGKLVQTFISNQNQSQGEYKQLLQFNSTLSSGNYLLNISNGKSNQDIKISLVK